MARKYKKNKKKQIILLLIIILAVFTVFYSINKDKTTVDNNKSGQFKNSGIVIYPGSSEKLYTEGEDRITINYKTPSNTTYAEVVLFYVENMPKLGWKLVSQSEVDAVFEKNSKKARVWILYTDNRPDGVDYIIDYTPNKKNDLQLN